MRYTVNKLAKLSGVSPRTFRFYDKIDSLKPVSMAITNTVIMKRSSFLMFQQILFFREFIFLG